jgi:transcriptional regulator
MYVPAAFAVPEDEAVALLSRVRLGCLVSLGPEGFWATHMPFLHDPERGLLTGHLARANLHRSLAGERSEALVVFQGVEAYVSPNWYPSKAVHGRAVPTWNYEAVHVHGEVRWRDDRDWLLDHLRKLTARFEGGRPDPWTLEEAPEGYVERVAAGAVGVELTIGRIEAKRKMSQNLPEADRAGVAAALGASADLSDRAAAAVMAALQS